MTEKINLYGLYKTTVPRYRIPGLKSDVGLDRQTSGWWLPFLDKNGDVHMVDTYHLDSFRGEHKDVLKNLIDLKNQSSENTYLINRSNYDFYYGGSVKITNVTMPLFIEVCDLRDMEIVKEARDYDDKDKVVHVQLYREHGYPHGVTLLRKGAKINPDIRCRNLIDTIMEDCRNRWFWTYNLSQLNELKETVSEDLKSEIEEINRYFKKERVLDDMHQELTKEFKKAHCKNAKTKIVIAVSGPACIGKTTFSNFLLEELNKEMHVILQPLATDLKRKAILLGWNEEKDHNGRLFLQNLSKTLRAYHGEEYYAQELYKFMGNSNFDVIIIDDARMRSEMEYLKNKEDIQLITVKIVNENFVSPLSVEAQKDVTENDLKDYAFDYEIINESTLEDLKNEAIKFSKTIIDLIKKEGVK